MEAKTWQCRHVTKLAFRYYALRFVAMEIFMADHTVLMVNCKTPEAAQRLHAAISLKSRPSGLVLQPQEPREVLKWTRAHGLGLTEAWVQREITNFEYLMTLNTIAGRTYNDLAQYPIFPWVLSDFESASLDLTDPKSFRDLRFPVGIQRPEARAEVAGRYRELESMFDSEDGDALDPLSAPFHYGVCYSNPAFVLWYLTRLEPFTSLSIHLHDGHLDKADRMFRDLGATYRACTSNPTDVKELIPEFFYMAEFLDKPAHLDLGTTQAGEATGSVKLPPWALGDSKRFVRLHREALESEFVSANLHHWVDLIFGYKQRPPQMVGPPCDQKQMGLCFS